MQRVNNDFRIYNNDMMMTMQSFYGMAFHLYNNPVEVSSIYLSIYSMLFLNSIENLKIVLNCGKMYIT